MITFEEYNVNKNNYKRTEKVKFKCINCGIDVCLQIRVLKRRCLLLCPKCLTIKTNNEKYGCNYSSQNKNIANKQKITKSIKHKDKNYLKKLDKKSKATRLLKYGNENFNNSKKRRDTKKKKYNDEFFTNRDKFIKTCNEKYDGCGFASSIIRNKIEKTNLDRHNNINYRNHEQALETAINNGGIGGARETTLEKIKITNLKKYGNEYIWQNPDIHHKCMLVRKKNNIEKYGVENVTQIPEVSANLHKKYLYNDIFFDSSWELIYYIWLNDNNINFEYHSDKLPYYYKNKLHFYEIDFTINNKYFEIKGPQFFDEFGKMINPYDRKYDDLYNCKYYCMLTNNVNIITDISLQKTYVENKYGKNYVKQFKYNKEDNTCLIVKN